MAEAALGASLLQHTSKNTEVTLPSDENADAENHDGDGTDDGHDDAEHDHDGDGTADHTHDEHDGAALKALEGKVAGLVAQVESLTDELTDTRKDLAQAMQQIDEADDKIWALTPKEDLPEEGQHVFFNCKTNGKAVTVAGYTLTFTDGMCAQFATSNPEWAEKGCTCADESTEEKLAQKACDGKRDHDACEWRIEDRKVKQKSNGNHTDYTATVFQSVCLEGKCVPYSNLNCATWSRETGTEFKPVGTRCVYHQPGESFSGGWCRGENGGRGTYCSQKSKVTTYQLSRCVYASRPVKREPEKTECLRGYHPEWQKHEDLTTTKDPNAAREITIDIGKSDENKKCVQSEENVECDKNAGDRDNRMNNHNGSDRFDITVNGKEVCAQRLGSTKGWGMDLQISCKVIE